MNLTEDDCAVKIAVRERPLREIFKNNEVKSAIKYHSSNSNILVVDERVFAFDHVLTPSVSQEELFNMLVSPLVDKVLKGFYCTALAYGQTGTGKSFTMGLNPESIEGVNVGIIPRCIQAVLEKKAEENMNKYEISASFIEIYSEKVFDLLGNSPAEPIIARGYKFTGGTKKRISTIQDGYDLLQQGTKNRHVRPTKMNPQSSRSHAIFTIYIRNEIQNKIIQSCLNLVDLAGSEGVRRTGHQGVALSEGVHINQGLLSMGKVLQAITQGYKVIPYRDSVLSSVLQDSLNPNSFFTLLACVSPHQEDLSETLSTIRFAQNAKNLKHNPQINSKLMEMKKSKTPHKTNPLRQKNTLATPQTNKRTTSLANFGSSIPAYHGNTFCTPSKQRKTEIPVLNRTIVGLTPKEKQKIGSVKMSKVVPFSYKSPVRESINSEASNSLDIHDSRSSLMSLNISSSTTIDAPVIDKGPSSYSPIERKCMAKMENIFKSSMSQFLETLKNNQCERTPSHFQSPMSYEENIRTIIRQELFSIASEKRNQEFQKIDNGVNEELFYTESNPIFKIPVVPQIKSNVDYSCSQIVDYNSIDSEHFLSIEETVLPSKPLRRSQRLSSRTQLSNASDDSVFVPKRRSARLSVKSLNDAKRRSVRLLSHKEEDEVLKPYNATPPKSSKKVNKQDKSLKCLVQNPTIAGYFEKKENTKPTNLKTNLAKHQKAILEMLNSASMKELQFLPQIGLKTAFQIVTQRTLHGKFKNFTQVSKLPIWRGKAWERFKEANSII